MQGSVTIIIITLINSTSLDRQISLVKNYIFPCSNSLREVDTTGKIIFKFRILRESPLIQYHRKDICNSALMLGTLTDEYFIKQLFKFLITIQFSKAGARIDVSSHLNLYLNNYTIHHSHKSLTLSSSCTMPPCPQIITILQYCCQQ